MLAALQAIIQTKTARRSYNTSRLPCKIILVRTLRSSYTTSLKGSLLNKCSELKACHTLNTTETNGRRDIPEIRGHGNDPNRALIWCTKCHVVPTFRATCNAEFDATYIRRNFRSLSAVKHDVHDQYAAYDPARITLLGDRIMALFDTMSVSSVLY